MVRISKQQEIRSVSRRRPRPPAAKTGAKKDNLQEGYKAHTNALNGDLAKNLFIPKIR